MPLPRAGARHQGYVKPSRDCKGAVTETPASRCFLPFACYGVHLHGHESGSVDRRPGARRCETPTDGPGARLPRQGPPGGCTRCSARGLFRPRLESLGGKHVRTNHVHVVVEADVLPEKVMNAFKSYASRGPNRLEIDGGDRKRWARHGSTRWLWKDEDVQEAIRYVVSGQGEPMEVYRTDGR